MFVTESLIAIGNCADVVEAVLVISIPVGNGSTTVASKVTDRFAPRGAIA